MCEMAEAVEISTEWVHHICHEQLDITHRMTISKEFLQHFVIVEETWIHSTIPDTKKQSIQWVSSNKRAPKKIKEVSQKDHDHSHLIHLST